MRRASVRSAPKARARSAVTTALSTPPETPTTAPRRRSVPRTCSRSARTIRSLSASGSMASTPAGIPISVCIRMRVLDVGGRACIPSPRTGGAPGTARMGEAVKEGPRRGNRGRQAIVPFDGGIRQVAVIRPKPGPPLSPFPLRELARGGEEGERELHVDPAAVGLHRSGARAADAAEGPFEIFATPCGGQVDEARQVEAAGDVELHLAVEPRIEVDEEVTIAVGHELDLERAVIADMPAEPGHRVEQCRFRWHGLETEADAEAPRPLQDLSRGLRQEERAGPIDEAAQVLDARMRAIL